MSRKRNRFLVITGAVAIASLLLSVMAGCQGTIGPAGTSSGTLSGTVTNSLTGIALAGATITPDPPVKGTITTSANGTYSIELPIGVYTLTFKKDNFTAVTQTVSLVAGQTTTKDVTLKPVSAVVINAGTAKTSPPGSSVTLKVTTETFDGSTVKSYRWTQTAGVEATIDNPDTETINVTLGNAAAYKDMLLKALELLDRFTVLGINPHALSTAETATFKATVTTSSGNYTATVNVNATLPYEVTTGLQNVPVGVPVLLHAKTQSDYQWTLAAPADSKAALDNNRDQNPSFIPDITGKYTLTENTSGASIDVYTGTWSGAITGQDANGRPLAAACTACHDGNTAPDKFTAWKDSGHAEIFTQNINDPAGHWSISCAPCHTVGYDPEVTNGGFDEAVAAEGWEVPPHGEVGLYTKMLTQYPKTTGLSNIQCENCHGPNNSPLHANGLTDTARISLSADVCGSCHGEPPRHGRFQQWESSGHGNYELAIDESGSSSCARCHTGQGFLLWLKQGDLTKPIQGANGNATAAELAAMGITKDTAQPQTCAVCHDPHQQGTISSKPTNATVRVVDETSLLPAGFQATVVGKGALCMTCHNTRNQLHNTDAPPTSYSGPHYSSQADVLMGENAYFVAVGQRSPHSYIEDTCVTCHMEKTPPPEGYTQTGTNHSFNASLSICGECHSSTLNAEALQAGVEEKIEELSNALGQYLLKKLPAEVTVKDYAEHEYSGKSYDVLSAALVISKDSIVSVEAAHIHGQQGFIFKLESPVTVTYAPAGESSHSVSVSTIEARLGDITTDGTKAVIAVTDNLVKAGWNLALVEDGSLGIHNPAFTSEVLEASIESLKQ